MSGQFDSLIKFDDNEEWADGERERERKNKRTMDFHWQVRQLEGNVNWIRCTMSSREVGKFLLNARAFVKKESVLIALKTCT